jgi:hypothetical protein
MKTPTDYDIERMFHGLYDPIKAHEYYIRTRKLKGRKPSQAAVPAERRNSAQHPGRNRGRTRAQIHKDARAHQRKELAQSIHNLESKLKKLEAKIREKEHAEASDNRKGKAKKERAAKAKQKPKTAAEKAKAARENEQYRKKNQQKLKTKAHAKSGGGSSKGKGKAGAHKHSISELKSLATKVKGQIQVAKQKLAAL